MRWLVSSSSGTKTRTWIHGHIRGGVCLWLNQMTVSKKLVVFMTAITVTIMLARKFRRGSGILDDIDSRWRCEMVKLSQKTYHTSPDIHVIGDDCFISRTSRTKHRKRTLVLCCGC